MLPARQNTFSYRMLSTVQLSDSVIATTTQTFTHTHCSRFSTQQILTILKILWCILVFLVATEFPAISFLTSSCLSPGCNLESFVRIVACWFCHVLPSVLYKVFFFIFKHRVHGETKIEHFCSRVNVLGAENKFAISANGEEKVCSL